MQSGEHLRLRVERPDVQCLHTPALGEGFEADVVESYGRTRGSGLVGPLTAFLILSTNGVTLFLVFYVVTSCVPVVALLRIDRGRPRSASRADGTAMRAPSAGVTHIRGSVVLRRLLVLRCLASALPSTLIGALIVLEFESYAAAPLLFLAVSNAMVYLGNQYVSRMADFREVEIVLVYGTMSLAGIALLNVENMYAFLAGVAVFGIATGVGLSHFVLATVVHSPPVIYGSISGVFGLTSSALGLTVGVMLSQVDAIGLDAFYLVLTVLAVGTFVAAVRYARTDEVARAGTA